MHKENDKLAAEKEEDKKFFNDAKERAITDKKILQKKLDAMECVQDRNDELRSANFAANKAAESYEQAYDGLCKELQKYGCGNDVCKLKFFQQSLIA